MSVDSRNRDAGPTSDDVRERLDRVRDPELDESIVELEYLTDLRIDGGHVRVRFTLPTAWCSPAFAWMMASDAREEVGELDGVESVRVELHDHMHDEEITRGVNEGLAFEEAFEEAEGDVEVLRRKLDGKARLARQYRAMKALRGAGLNDDQLRTLSTGALDLDDEREEAIVALDGALRVRVPYEPLADYLEIAARLGTFDGDGDRLFRGPGGEAIGPGKFEEVYRRGRLANTNIGGQASVCAGLHEARNGVPAED